jgi:hypothetical protein
MRRGLGDARVVAVALLVACSVACSDPSSPDAQTSRAHAASILGGFTPSAADTAHWRDVFATRDQTRAVIAAAGIHLAEHPGMCPSAADLVREGLLNPSSSAHDPWGQSFAIECVGEIVRVCSAGPDGHSGTLDDICEPRAGLAH